MPTGEGGGAHEVEAVLYLVRVPSKVLLVEICSRVILGELGKSLEQV